MDVQILGMFDSGTNLLLKLLRANFPDVQVATHCHNGGIWKHTPPSELSTNASTGLFRRPWASVGYLNVGRSFLGFNKADVCN